MTLHTVQVLTLFEAAAALAEGGRVDCIVSIGDPGEPPPRGFDGVAHRLRLELVDACEESAGRVATLADIQRLVEFVPTIGGIRGTTVIHCRAAMSRSPAATLIVFAAMLGPGREAEAVDALFQLKPWAQPNRLMVRLGDEALGREGKLVEALESRPLRR
jgi:predicted protein tyrosine phosphatase